MANVIISPNMSLPVPVVSVDPGPDYATNINASLSILDQHNHSSGQGVQINPNGLNINSDLSFNSNNATSLRSSRYSSQTAVLTNPADIGCTYVVSADLYYNDGNGNNIRITQGGAVTGATGTITGLPSGTASASYSAGTFTFLAATNTPATMATGPLVVGNQVANSKTVTISPNASIGGNYNLTLPAALPAGINYVTLDNSGNLSFNSSGSTGTGAVVLAASPTFSGTVAGSIAGALYTPTLTWGIATPTVNSTFASYTLINNIVFSSIAIQYTTGGSTSFLSTFTIPVPTTSLTGACGIFQLSTVGGGSTVTSQVLNNASNSIMKTLNGGGGSVTTSTSYLITINFSYQVS